MSVPEFQSFMLPVLKLFEDKEIHNTNECIRVAVNSFNLSDEDIKLTVPSGKQTLVANRVYWSLMYLKKSLLIETVKRGEYVITDRGLELLKNNHERIDKKLLSNYEEYRTFNSKRNKNENNEITEERDEDVTPEENIDAIYKKINEQLSDDLLEIIKDKDPYCFERLVMDVLTKMGYGDPNTNSNIVTKKSCDEGIDGVINQDRLGLDKIYVQAKRWNENVSRPEIQKFVGALSSKKSSKGIFITTSDFSKEAKEYVRNLQYSIILINGKELARLMIEYNVGVQVNFSYDLKGIDNDYFEII